MRICWLVGAADEAPVAREEKLETEGEPSEGVWVERNWR